MRLLFLIVSLFFLESCSKPKSKFSDDDVLIEFAAKLEGEYHTPQKNNPHQKYHSNMPQDYNATPDPATNPQDP